jgi:D-glycero-D-manno-heptose 1,7-bisphosphate phosphatase
MLLGMLRYLRSSPTASTTKRPALFVDRDGVLNRLSVGGYVTSPSQLEVLDSVLPALDEARRSGARVVVISNQGCIARGIATEGEVLSVNAALIDRLADRGASVDAIYICPHHPAALHEAERHCSCRKPAPGMLAAAARDLEIDLSDSLFIGDQLTDLQAGRAAGIPAENLIHVNAAAMSAGDTESLVARTKELLRR